MSEEGDIQRAITKALEARGAKVYRMNASRGGRQQRAFNPPGTPDLFVVERKRHYWIEVKTPGGKVSPIQEAQHADLKRCGMEVFVVRSADSVAEGFLLS